MRRLWYVTCTCCNYPIIVYIIKIDLTAVKDRRVEDLSGGELQRFACAVVCVQKADM